MIFPKWPPQDRLQLPHRVLSELVLSVNDLGQSLQLRKAFEHLSKVYICEPTVVKQDLIQEPCRPYSTGYDLTRPCKSLTLRALKSVIVQGELFVDHLPNEGQGRGALLFAPDEVVVPRIVHILLLRNGVHVLSDYVVEPRLLQDVVGDYFHRIIFLLSIVIERHETKRFLVQLVSLRKIRPSDDKVLVASLANQKLDIFCEKHFIVIIVLQFVCLSLLFDDRESNVLLCLLLLGLARVESRRLFSFALC